MTSDGSAKAFRHLMRRCGGRPEQRNELVAARVRKEFTFTQIRARQVEDRPKRPFGVGMTKFVCEPSIVVDVGDE